MDHLSLDIIPTDCNHRRPKHLSKPRGYNLSEKRPIYCQPSKLNWKECRQVIKNALSSDCKNWCKQGKSDKKSIRIFLNC